MGKGSLQAFAAIPGAATLRPLLASFAAREGGAVTALSDRRLRSLQGLTGDLDGVEVVSFGEVVARALSTAGGDPKSLAQSGHVTAAIAEACRNLEVESPFFSCRSYHGFHQALVETLRELHHWRIDPDRLDSLAGTASPRLSEKIRSIAAIDRDVERSLEELGRCRGARLLTECAGLKPIAGAELGRIFAVLGSEATPIDVDWLRWAASSGASVTAVTERHATDEGFFRSEGLDFGVRSQPVGRSNSLLSNLFCPSVLPMPDGFRVRIVSAADPLAEAEWALRGCLDHLAAGIPESEIGIYARDLSAYGPIVEAAALRFGAKVRIVRRTATLSNRFALWTLNLLEALASSDVRALLTVVRSGYAGVSGRKRYEIEGAIQTAWRGGDEAWRMLLEWNDGREDSIEWFGTILAWRKESVGEAAVLGSWNLRLRKLLDTLIEQCPGMAETTPQSTRDQRARASMERALAQRVSLRRLRDDSPIQFSEYLDFARDAWAASETSAPPSETGIVVASSIEEFGPLRVVAAVGMLEGQFPRRRSEEPILTDSERGELSSLAGLEAPLLTSRDRAAGEREEFYRLCAAASDELSLSYPQTDDDRDNVPAFYLEEVARATGDSIDRIDYPRPELAPSIDRCSIVADRILRESIDAEPIDRFDRGWESRAAIEAWSWPNDRGFTPRELREAAQCPFQFFARRRLDLTPISSTSRWFGLLRLPASARLASQPDRATALQSLRTQLDEMAVKISPETAPWDLAALRSGGERILSQWVDREFSAREVWHGTASQTHYDVRFGGDLLKSDFPGDLAIEGSVSGVRDTGSYRIVALYEAGLHVDETAPLGVVPLGQLDELYLGLHLAQVEGAGGVKAVEVETLGSKRFLVVMHMPEDRRKRSDSALGLKVVELFPGDHWQDSAKKFATNVMAMASGAATVIRSVSAVATPGDHCRHCDFGELCRRSSDFGELESPFDNL